ncbi:hypothetical protein [Propionibacterium cyclohexanicum]|nr:hypothetical protein [Propionibacterium cyclohexanicum]
MPGRGGAPGFSEARCAMVLLREARCAMVLLREAALRNGPAARWSFR